VSRVFVTGAASGIGRHLVGALDRAGHRVIAADLNQDGPRPGAGARGLVRPSCSRPYLDVTSETDWSAALDPGDRSRRGRRRDDERGRRPLARLRGRRGRGGHRQDLPGERARRRARDARGGPADDSRRTSRGTSSTSARSRRSHRSRGCRSTARASGAVRGFTLSAAVELEAQRISVSLVCPDAVETPMLDLQKGRAEAALTFSGSRPLTVDEVSRVVLEHVLPARPLEVSIPTGARPARPRRRSSASRGEGPLSGHEEDGRRGAEAVARRSVTLPGNFRVPAEGR
jgi:3-oxoacyl-[acyl-carrier protein] reductase